MQKIISEIKNSQTTWRKSFYAALMIAVVLFFFRDRFYGRVLDSHVSCL